MRRADAGRRRRERGTVMVLAAIAMTALIMFAALAIDVGILWSSRTQSQNASDAAALAAVMNMLSSDGSMVTLNNGRDEAEAVAALNRTVSNPSVALDRNNDIVFGYYDLLARQAGADDGEAFYPIGSSEWTSRGLDANNPSHVRAAQVAVVMDGTTNDVSPTFLSALVGRNSFNVRNTAIAYLGFEGCFGAGEFELPVAIDSCDLVSDPSGCGSDFCTQAQTPVNPCPLSKHPQAGDGDVTCLEFSSNPEQNACWTVYDGDNPSVNNPDLGDVVDDGNPNDTETGDEVYLDNGDKSVTTRKIHDKFYGFGDYDGNPSGEDRYPPFDGFSDSWVVKLPVMECQDDNECAGGDPQKIIGGVCFQVREILAPPYDSDRLIKGRFLCKNDTDPDVQALFEMYCADDGSTPPGCSGGPGGCDYGFDAKTVVLVE